MLYYAVRIKHQEQVLGCVRCALSTIEINNKVTDIQSRIAKLVIVVVVIGLLLTGLVVYRMTRPVVRLIEEAR